MRPSLIRRQLGGIVPPKIATPTILTAGSGEGLKPLVDFYSKLPKGRAPATGVDEDSKAARGLGWLILGLFSFGYVADYQMHLKHHKNHPH